MSPVARACLPLGLLLSVACGSGDDASATTSSVDAGGSGGSGGGGGSAEAGANVAIEKIQITVGNLVFDARAAGPEDGDLVLLLHGFPQNSYEWRHQLVSLAEKGYRAVAPDQRGYSPGARPTNVEAYGVLALAGDVTGMADALGAERFHVVGHDWGAAVAWVVALVNPDRVGSVSPISVPHPDAFRAELANPDSCQYAASAYFDFFTTPAATDSLAAPGALAGLYTDVPQEDVDVYVAELGDRETIDAGLDWYRANVSNRQLAGTNLGSVKVPTMFAWSDGDTFLCRDGAEKSRDYVEADYSFEVITGVNHWVPDLASDQYTPLLLAQLAAHPL